MVPLEIAAPERHAPPLGKLHSSWPVAALSAYMWPSGSTEHPKTTPLAVVTGPDVPPPCVGRVCQMMWPSLASSADQTPVVSPRYVLRSLLAFAVYAPRPGSMSAARFMATTQLTSST